MQKSPQCNKTFQNIWKWKSERETLKELRKLKPTLHKSTLGRMRRRREIAATKFAGSWFYKPETAVKEVQTSMAA